MRPLDVLRSAFRGRQELAELKALDTRLKRYQAVADERASDLAVRIAAKAILAW